MRSAANRFHSGRRVRRTDHVEPCGNRAAAVGLFTDPGDRQILAGAARLLWVAAQDTLLVLADVQDDRLVALAADDFLTLLEVEPVVAASVLPTDCPAG